MLTRQQRINTESSVLFILNYELLTDTKVRLYFLSAMGDKDNIISDSVSMWIFSRTILTATGMEANGSIRLKTHALNSVRFSIIFVILRKI